MHNGMPSAAFDDVLSDAAGQQLVAGVAFDDGSDFVVAKPFDVEPGNVRSSDPERLELRSVGDCQ
jgi:hypothetical protein